MKTDFVKNPKLQYTDSMDNMQDTLRNGLRQYERHIKSVTDIMENVYKKLVEQQQMSEYVKYLRTDKDNTKQKRLSLLIQNSSLLKMEFLSNEKKPSQAQIERSIQVYLE